MELLQYLHVCQVYTLIRNSNIFVLHCFIMAARETKVMQEACMKMIVQIRYVMDEDFAHWKAKWLVRR